MNTFIGILLIMGVVRLPEIRLYWSNSDMYANARIKNAMKHDRFLSILKFLHFSDNTTARTEDRLHKIRNIVEAIVDTFKSAIKPGKIIVIDESMIPWIGRLGFRQYIPGKRHKYGIKLYKLCLPGDYTYNINIYAGKNATAITKTRSHDVVMKLMSGLLSEGRILCTDSYYTSVPLAEELLEKNTFICGTVKMNRKFLPPQAKRKQHRGGIMSLENRNGVKFLKWTDKRPVRMLSTCENHMCKIIQGKNNKLKPDTVLFYNDAKKGVDLSDQMSSYYSSLRKTVKWYRKIIIQLICGTCIVNAWYIHQKWGNKHINTLKFREHIIDHLLVNNYRSEEMAIGKQIPSKRDSHFLHSYEGPTRKTRQRCKECYKCLYKKKR
ncbi:PiggyBac transposable element-derived protein 4 [Anthophora retusa]